MGLSNLSLNPNQAVICTVEAGPCPAGRFTQPAGHGPASAVGVGGTSTPGAEHGPVQPLPEPQSGS